MAQRKKRAAKKAPKTAPAKPAAEETIAGREDLTVTRAGGSIVKTAYTDRGRAELANEARFLEILASTPFGPTLRTVRTDTLVVEDIGDGQPVRDEAAFLRASVALLCEFRARGVRHGDLTAKNLIVRDDRPVAVDFGQSSFADEGLPCKRPKPDAHYFWRAINEIRPIRLVQRWLAVRAALGGDEDGAWDCLAGRDVLDLGCYSGEAAAMAAAEGARAVGVDSDAAAVRQARDLWGGYGCQFLNADLVGYEPEAADIVFLFSTFAYMVRQHGRDAAEATLATLIERAQVLFFETQLLGDGPGPDFLRDDEDVAAFLGRYGRVQRLVTIPVAGREAHRSVWSVKPK